MNVMHLGGWHLLHYGAVFVTLCAVAVFVALKFRDRP